MKWTNENGVIVNDVNMPVAILAPGVDSETSKVIQFAPEAKTLFEKIILDADKGKFHKKKIYNEILEHLKNYSR